MPRNKKSKADKEREPELIPTPILPVIPDASSEKPKGRSRRSTKTPLLLETPLTVPALAPTPTPVPEVVQPVVPPEVRIDEATITQATTLRQQLHEALGTAELFPTVLQRMQGEMVHQHESFRKQVDETKPLFQDLVQQAKAVHQQLATLLASFANTQEPFAQLKETAKASQEHLESAEGQLRELLGQAKECGLRLGEVLPHLSETERRFEGVEQSTETVRQELELLRKQTEQARSDLQSLRKGTQEAVRDLALVQKASREAIQSLVPLQPMRQELASMGQEIRNLLGQARECGQRFREVLPHLPQAAQEIRKVEESGALVRKEMEALRAATSATRLELEAVRQETLETGASVALIRTQVQDTEKHVEASPGQGNNHHPQAEPNHLGVTVTPVVVVTEVSPGTPAAETEIAPGDIIDSINGQKVTNGTELRAAVQEALAGEQVTLKFTRSGVARETLIWIAPHATEPEHAEEHNRLGITVDSAVLVVEVESASLAEAAGLLTGDVIREVDGAEITTGEQLRQAIHNAADQTEIDLEVSRGSELRQVVVRFPGTENSPAFAGSETVRAEPPF